MFEPVAGHIVAIGVVAAIILVAVIGLLLIFAAGWYVYEYFRPQTFAERRSSVRVRRIWAEHAIDGKYHEASTHMYSIWEMEQ